MPAIDFRKMEATGNDYVYFGPFIEAGEISRPRTEEVLEWLTEDRIRHISDRHFGIGGDGVVLVGPANGEGSAARMFMWNADGSPSAMCGNALRSVAALLHEHLQLSDFSVETGDHTYHCAIEGVRDGQTWTTVNMGPPILDPEQVPYAPVLSEILEPADVRSLRPASIKLHTPAQDWTGRILSMGNPHFVVDVTGAKPSLDRMDLRSIGPGLEHHVGFPERVNIEFIEWVGDATIRQRTFERGSGETLSCGSGACAAFIAARAEKPGLESLTIRLRGGNLQLSLKEGNIWMYGPARVVFGGTLEF